MTSTETTWTVETISSWIEDYLRSHGDANPKVSTQWLVGDTLGMSKMDLLLNRERPLSTEERSTLRDYTKRRAAGEPLQYITGTTDFRFITVDVLPGILIPRPETEVLVSEVLAQLPVSENPYLPSAKTLLDQAARVEAFDALLDGEDATVVEDRYREKIEGTIDDEAPNRLRLLDVGTGTGCIACSLAYERPDALVVACDIDPRAVGLARRNAQKSDVSDRVDVVQSDLLSTVPHADEAFYDAIVSNPPYIPTEVLEQLDDEVTKHEGALALDGGKDGLDVFRCLTPQVYAALKPNGVYAVELHETCLDEAAAIAEQQGFVQTRIVADLAGRPRVLVARKG